MLALGDYRSKTELGKALDPQIEEGQRGKISHREEMKGPSDTEWEVQSHMY